MNLDDIGSKLDTMNWLLTVLVFFSVLKTIILMKEPK